MDTEAALARRIFFARGLFRDGPIRVIWMEVIVKSQKKAKKR